MVEASTAPKTNRVFLDCADINGEAIETEYADQTNILRADLKVVCPVQRANGATNPVGASQHSGLTLTKHTCLGTPDIVKHCMAGSPIADCTITFARNTGSGGLIAYREIVLTGARITAYNLLDSRGFDLEQLEMPIESFTIDYAVITDTYTKFTEMGIAGGSNDMTYNVIQNAIE